MIKILGKIKPAFPLDGVFEIAVPMALMLDAVSVVGKMELRHFSVRLHRNYTFLYNVISIESTILLPQVMMVAKSEQGPQLKCGVRSAECGVVLNFPLTHQCIFAVRHKNGPFQFDAIYLICPDRKRLKPKTRQIFVALRMYLAAILVG